MLFNVERADAADCTHKYTRPHPRPSRLAQAVPSETLQMEPAARDNQQSMTLKKIVAKCESDPATTAFGLMNPSAGYGKRELQQGSASRLSTDSLTPGCCRGRQGTAWLDSGIVEASMMPFDLDSQHELLNRSLVSSETHRALMNEGSAQISVLDNIM